MIDIFNWLKIFSSDDSRHQNVFRTKHYLDSYSNRRKLGCKAPDLGVNCYRVMTMGVKARGYLENVKYNQ